MKKSQSLHRIAGVYILLGLASIDIAAFMVGTACGFCVLGLAFFVLGILASLCATDAEKKEKEP